MLFNSLEFLIFLPLAVLAYSLTSKNYRWLLLLGASYYFYMCWNASYAILIAFSTIITYLSGIALGRASSLPRKKIIVALSFTVNLAILVFYKYFNFLSQTLADFFHLFAMDFKSPLLSLLLPVGISFYTFQALSYTMDVYREEIPPERHFGRYALFVSYFPQLVAGPIERSKHLLPQLKNLTDLHYGNLRNGALLMAWGFFKKMVIADKMAILVNTVYDDPANYQGIETFIAIIFFSIQIYCDFSGYTDIARGVARMMGIDIMKNFESPYFSQSITEFWRRWHISLSTWFRDYLYIPLGGSRRGGQRTYINLFIVFLISGLWHGAAITFVVWGSFHGILIIVEKMARRRNIGQVLQAQKKSFSQRLSHIMITNILVVLLWVFFRAESFWDSLVMLKNLFIWDRDDFFNGSMYSLGLDATAVWTSLFFCGVMLLVEYINSFVRPVLPKLLGQPMIIRWMIYLILVLTILLFGEYGEERKAFIYFQF